MRTGNLYIDTLRRLQLEGWLTAQDQVLVIAGGRFDRDVLVEAGLDKVTITSLDERLEYVDHAPYEWSLQDAENLRFDDNSFDICIAHQGLHHCSSPHRALLEMYRVARRGVLVIEPVDNLVTRLGLRLGVCQEYEIAAVTDNGMSHGGVANTAVPNYVYRWTPRELRKTLATSDPTGRPRVRCLYYLGLPQGWGKSPMRRALSRALLSINRVLPGLANSAGFAIDKLDPVADLHPWLTTSPDGAVPNTTWFHEYAHTVEDQCSSRPG